MGATSSCVVDTADVLGWWRGEDTPNGEVGPALSGAVGYADGKVGRSMALDESSQLSTAALATVSTAVSVEMWVKPVSSGAVEALMSRWDFPSADDSARSYGLFIEPSGTLLWTTDETSSRRPLELRASAPQLFDGSYHFVVATWDATTMAMYVDGAVIASQASQGGELNAAPSTAFRLGSKSGLGDMMRFQGDLDEATVWGRALTPAEVSAIFAAGTSGKCTFVPTQQAKLLASSGALLDQFGVGVSIDRSTIVAGAPYSSVANQFAGAAYVYVLNNGTWTEQARLLASDRATVDLFGWSVAVDTDTIVVGSYGNNGGGQDSGAAYVFARNGTAWAQQAKLLPGDIAAGDGAGYSVAISGDTLVVGAPLDDVSGMADGGSVTVFARSGTTWSQQAKLAADDPAAGDNFGYSVAIDGDTVIVGSPGDDDAGASSGSTYVFTRSGSAWAQQAKLVAADADAGDLMGSAVGLHAETVVVGAPDDDDTATDSGSGYVFVRSSGAWSQEAKLVASDPSAGALFGVSAGFDGTLAVLGAYQDAPSQTGSAYVFGRTGSTWSQTTKLIADDAQGADAFGRSVSVDGRIVVGASFDDDRGTNSGSAYVFGH